MQCTIMLHKFPQIFLRTSEQIYAYDTFMPSISDDPALPVDFNCVAMTNVIPHPLPVDILADVPLIP